MLNNDNTSIRDMSSTVHAEKLMLLYQQSFIAVIGNTVTAFLVVIILWPAQESTVLLGWLAVLLATVIGRIYLYLKYIKVDTDKQDILDWERPYLFVLTFSALIWGIGGVIIMPADSLVHEAMVFYFLIGMAGGAISFYSVHRFMTLTTIVCLLLPAVLWFLYIGNYISIGMAVGAILFILAAMRSVKLLSSSLHQNFVLTYELREAKEHAERLARKDALTGLNNRRAFYERMEELSKYCDRHTDAFTLVLVDLDHFKKINDTWGHAAGDYVLVQIANIFIGRVRGSDICARIGGEEFAVLLSSSGLEDGKQFAEELRRTIESQSLEYNGEKIVVTASLGVAQYGCDVDALVSHADDALYQAKEAGRNRVVCNSASEAE